MIFNTAVNRSNEDVWNSEYLWLDSTNSSFFQWGGERSALRVGDGTPISVLSKFSPDGHDGGSWTKDVGEAADSLFPKLVRGVGCATARGGDTWYMLGGYRSCYSDPTIFDICSVYLLGPMVSYNSATGLWSNDSAANFTPAGSAVWSRMHNAPFGSSNGLNIILGGGTTSSPTSDPPNLLSFDRIYIYDPSSKIFYNQTATGTSIPSPRERFCSVGVPGSNGTYEIFIYGGQDPKVADPRQQTNISDVVYVLSLPGFVWFQADFPATSARIMHSCNVVGKGGSQMIVVGGLDPTATNISIATRDPWSNGINIFDMSKLRWKDSYVPNDAKYQTPGVITEWYATHGRYPSFQNATLQSLFTQTPALSPSATPQQPHPDNHSNIGAIVGGVIGGVVVLAIVAVAAVVIWRSPPRWRNQRTQQGEFRKPELDTQALSDRSPIQKSRTVELDGSVIHEAMSPSYTHELDDTLDKR